MIISSLVLLAAGCSRHAEIRRRDSVKTRPAHAEIRIRRTALSYLNTPYQWGGSSRRGMDCSGFIRRVFIESMDKALPHSAEKLYYMSSPVNQRAAQTGDLVFLKTDSRNTISHVGLMLDRNEFIHASSSRGVIVSKLNEAYYKKRLIGIRRLNF